MARQSVTWRGGLASAVADVLADLGFRPDAVPAVPPLASWNAAAPPVSPARALGHLLATCAERTGCLHFGVLVGQKSGFSALGALGYIVRNSGDLRTALQTLAGRYDSASGYGRLAFIIQGDTASLRYTPRDSEADGADQVCDAVLSHVAKMLRTLHGSNWRTTVQLQRRRPADAGPWQACFQAAVQFNAEHSALSFPASWLAAPVPGADPVLREILEAGFEDAEVQADECFADRVADVVRSRLGEDLSSDNVASLLGMHRRSLARALRTEGTSYREVLERVRLTQAKHMLLHTDIPLSEVALAVGLSDASAFTRAFRRAEGVAPSLWRSRQATGRLAT